MKVALGAAAMAMALAQPALAHKKEASRDAPPVMLEPLPAEFDLARMAPEARAGREHAAPLDPEPPKGMDMREISWDPPGEQIEFEGGAVLMWGALGAERKGLPKLAHIALDWDF